ncbi:unnamed protein product [Chilo suppressalis]|uniref:Transmembrane protein 53 n=1 Tax=Chilo suppressalis TaxID=168631 RepID=A0ABN8AR65_CHISP|nr:hypothetical protein evm_002939 [Chilo suppressalis]CAH0397059.1 unnamed protein product [Chilo suppressalis]
MAAYKKVIFNVRSTGILCILRDPVVLCSPTYAVSREHFSKRDAHTQALTKNLQYISNDAAKLKVNPKTMRLDRDVKRPLCIFMSWMLAKPKHILKYADIYLEQGFDVVSVSCTPWQLMWPAKGSQLVGKQLMDFMAENDLSPLALHGFSVGAYVWGEGLLYAMKNKDKFQPVLDRMKSQVWDSAADITEIPIGFPSAVFPKNMVLQNALRAYTKFHLKLFHEAATRHYLASSGIYHHPPSRAPALFLLSKNDPVGAECSNRDVHDCWVKDGIQCTWICWDRSPHVLHFFHHPKEYLTALYNHLDKNGLITNREIMLERLKKS